MFKCFKKTVAPHLARLQNMNLKDVFLQQPQRDENYTIAASGISLNYAQQFIDDALLESLTHFFEEQDFRNRIEAMFRGDKINTTENRAVLHTALRSSDSKPLIVDGVNVRTEIKAEFDKMRTLAEQFFAGNIKGANGKVMTDIVNIGIGGSDLGPRMVARALRPDAKPHLKVHFISNVDGTDIFEVLQDLNPEITCFIVASKSFTTQETLMNAKTAKAWLQNNLKIQDVRAHFIGITAKPEKAIAWGIPENRLFTMWDFVGGRYSLWSSIGLPIALSIGFENFERLLRGAESMDQHFRGASWQKNLPVILAIISVLNQNFFGAKSHAVLPYDKTLELFPAYLQQADMESLGKRVTFTGEAVDYQTGVVLWGSVGTNGQHAFYQLLHQGTLYIPVDLILPLHARHCYQSHHDALMANCYGQKAAFLWGRTKEESYEECLQAGLEPLEATKLAPHKVIPGNRPANLITFDAMTPERLGALIALYEHKIFIESLIWDINAFDQWGVELGKTLAEKELKKLRSRNA